ncbi:MAG: fnr [Gammaproteobacteria bacterium]|jgi:CRP/FNR family transcriptional regulator|nr:fnr [Gammaproteobacteria bacterium]
MDRIDGFASYSLAKFNLINDKDLIKKQYHLEPGEILSTAGTPLNYLYIVQSGSIKHANITEAGNEQVADFYFAGDIIGLDSLSTHQHFYNLIALEQTHVCAIAIEDIEDLIKTESWMQEALLSLLSQKLLDRTQSLLIQHQHAEQKLAAFLLDLSKRLKRNNHSHQDYHLSMSRQEIGNYLHLSTETVSRIFSKFQLENLIDVQKKHIVLKDIKRLSDKVSH